MSRSSLVSHDRELFIKSQLIACHKALNKTEAPLKQKHVRALIVGTHKERSANVFWNTVSRIQLEKNPVLTWKFCHLLHKLIRDGHRKVPEDSHRFISRLVQLGNFWQHLRTSGYGMSNTTYCKMLASRLEFHKRHSSIPGSLNLTESQLNALTSDVNETFELGIEMLDQMDELLNLKTVVTNTMESLRWSSLVPQGQCLLAPLILVILDTSKLYDFLVKVIFKLHATCPPDMLAGHRERFYSLFRKTKKFYEEASNLQYFKYLVSIPTLPANAPNFLQASDLDSYQSPHAYLHGEGSSEGGDTPPDSNSMFDESIIDLSMPDPVQVAPVQQIPVRDPKDDIVDSLRADLDHIRQSHERLIQEARARIEQYENRLLQMKQESDLYKQTAEEHRMEAERLRNASLLTQQSSQATEELERKIQEKEQKFQKMKAFYDNVREEHINTLKEIGELRKKVENLEREAMNKNEELRLLAQRVEEAERERSLTHERAQTSANSIDDLQSQLVLSQIDIENLNRTLDELKTEHSNELKALEDRHATHLLSVTQSLFASVCEAALQVLDQCAEDLQNATSITYPLHLAISPLQAELEILEGLHTLVKDSRATENLCKTSIVFCHDVAESVVNCAAAAYTASIQHFEPINEQCRVVCMTATSLYKALHDGRWSNADSNEIPNLRHSMEKLLDLMKSLPTTSGDVDADTMGRQFEDEMKRMDEAIQNAVAMIEALQKKARENSSGVRLEVNDKILDSCNALMNAVRILVARSRDVQEEIVAQGKGTASPSEFYKRNHQWTEGLLSAARAVGVAATVLINSADGVVTGKGKYEHLIVSAQEIAASVAQLYVSSRVKADRDSKKMAELGVASKSVNTCTASVVATVKSGQQTLSDERILDFTHLSLHEAKKEEMESQVRTLELEAELTRERNRLAALRKHHYHLASIVANEQNQNGN
uniref:Huntingtin interacting protein 1 n=1 Tax=Acrobeloides nanus TaxID=290746 RepID=A0A914DPV0_9BILA